MFSLQIRSQKRGIDLSAVNEQRRISQVLLTEQRNQMSFFVTALLPVLVSILPKLTWSPLLFNQVMFFMLSSYVPDVLRCDQILAYGECLKCPLFGMSVL